MGAMDVTALSVFAAPRSFGDDDHIDLIQRSAARSWLRMTDDVWWFGDDSVRRVANDMGVHWGGPLPANGVPYVRDVFARAADRACHDVLCYANADVLLYGLDTAVGRIAGQACGWLLIGYRFDIEVGHDGHKVPDPAHYVERARKRDAFHIDYFCYPRGFWPAFETWPPFLLGRTKWDNWLVSIALQQNAHVIDATALVTCLHQDHPPLAYLDEAGIRHNEQAMDATGLPWGSLRHATHRLTADGRLTERRPRPC